jgi:toxin-antitoxin system PIN domain toxin
MKLPDVNIWIAMALNGHPFHTASKAWLDGQEESGSILFCRPTQQGLVRLLTTAAVMRGYGSVALGNTAAWNVFEDFERDTRIRFAHEPPGLEETWKFLALRKAPSPKLWMDAYLAAFAIRSGFQLVSADKAFSQFKDLDFHLIGDA